MTQMMLAYGEIRVGEIQIMEKMCPISPTLKCWGRDVYASYWKFYLQTLLKIHCIHTLLELLINVKLSKCCCI